jgi:hypothetical protein
MAVIATADLGGAISTPQNEKRIKQMGITIRKCKGEGEPLILRDNFRGLTALGLHR